MFGERLIGRVARPEVPRRAWRRQHALRNTSGRATPTFLRLEELEPRDVPASISVNAGQVIRAVNPQVLGINVAWWDSHLNTTQTKQMVQAAGLTMFRFPGGSSSDT